MRVLVFRKHLTADLNERRYDVSVPENIMREKMEDKDIKLLFGGIETPDFDIYYDHAQYDSKLKGVSIPPYLSKFEIPSKYITGIKKQCLGNCWIYAATAMYETFALSKGVASSNTDDEAILSETYMTYTAFDTKPSDPAYKNPYGKQVILNAQNIKEYAGRIRTDALAFFIRGDAHTEEKADPVDPSTKPDVGLAPRLRTITEEKCKGGYVTGFKYLENPRPPYPDKKFIDDIKISLLTYGPVTISFFFAQERINLVNKRFACFCEAAHPNWPPVQAGPHAVCIIGWDDDYPASNFKNGFQPKNNGAFLAKNSHGTFSNYDGYIWLSYEDETMKEACCITDMDTSFSAAPLKVLNYGNMGPRCFYKLQNTNQITFRCVYNTTGSNDILDSIGFVCDVPCLADVELISGGKSTTLFSNILLEYAGYLVKKVPFNVEFKNKNETFEISVTYKSINGLLPGVPLEYNDKSVYSNITLNAGTCFINNQDVTQLAAAENKDYGNIILPVILKANSAAAQNTVSGYENITVPAASSGMIRGLCSDYGLVPVEWRLEPYGTTDYYPSYQPKARMYRITDPQNQIIEQGIINGDPAGSDIYVTAIIGESDEIIMRKLFKCSIDAPADYKFNVSAVKDDNKVDISGSFGVENAEVTVSCNGQTQKTVTDKQGNWEIKDFTMYDAAQGWKDGYKNSSIAVEIYDNQKVPVKICGGSRAVTLSKPFEVKNDSKGGLIITIIGVSTTVGILAALAYSAANGGAGCPITITLGGKKFTIGRGFARNQAYTRFRGPESGTQGSLELEDGPFDSVQSAENVDIHLKKVKVDTAADADPENAGYYGGFAKKITDGGFVKNCTFTGEIESSGNSQVGVILGEGKGIEVTGCKTSVTVTGAASCGGIACKLTGSSSVTSCEVTGSLSSGGNTGGIAAEIEDAIISDCYVTSDITGRQAAGIVPSMSGTATVRRCYASGRIKSGQDGGACGIAAGIDGNKDAVAQNVSVCSHISGNTIARVSLFPGSGNVAYAGMHTDTGKTFSEDGAVLKEWYEFGTSALYENMGFDMQNVWEFVNTMMYLRLKESDAVYNYPFYIIAETENGKFQIKAGEELTLTGFKNAAMQEIKWTGITPQTGMRSSEENFWTSANTFVLTVPFIPTQVGTYDLLLSGTMNDDVYAITLPFEVL